MSADMNNKMWLYHWKRASMQVHGTYGRTVLIAEF
jgi:hypothetical protein